MIKIKLSNISINIILSNETNSTPERDLELLVQYVDAVKTIYDGIN